MVEVNPLLIWVKIAPGLASDAFGKEQGLGDGQASAFKREGNEVVPAGMLSEQGEARATSDESQESILLQKVVQESAHRVLRSGPVKSSALGQRSGEGWDA